MSKYSESIYLRLNKFLEESMRGRTELGGTVDNNKVIIPPASSYVTDVATNDGYATGNSAFVIPFFTPGGQQSESITPWTSSTSTYANLPIATYTILEPQTNDTPWEICGQITYTFFHGETSKLIEIKEFLRDLCKRQDWSASDANYFFRNDLTNPFEFKVISFMNSSGPIPPEDEGGRYAWLVSLYVSATYEGPNRNNNYSAQINLGMI